MKREKERVDGHFNVSSLCDTSCRARMSDSEEPPGGSTGPWSVVSMKSDRSKDEPLFFSRGSAAADSPSMKSDRSKDEPLFFSRESAAADSLAESPDDPSLKTDLDAVFKRLEEDIVTFVREELQKLHRLLTTESTSESTPEITTERDQQSTEAVLNITLDFLRRMELEHLAERLRNKPTHPVSCELKSQLHHKFSRMFEGVAKAGDSAPLQQIYTELYIIEGGPSEVNQEHEVRHMETASRRPAERAITCEDLFKQPPESEQPIRAVLTKGVAGVGKTVLTQKFCLDWVERRAHQDVQLLFHFTFRELNVLRGSEYSLVKLIHHVFSQTIDFSSFKFLQLLFIFDGLDECRLPLDFSRTRVLTEPTESASVEELLVNLIRGNLLPSAHLWITTRPAAANQIPAECVSMVTEVRGFTDPQKEQYFRKRFRDEATAVISHIKSIRSLYIMSSIPVFCWILSTVLQKVLKQTEKPELPKTMTEMYVHFLVVQAKVKNIKYHGRSGADRHWTPETREMVWSLGKLAFEQLLKGNLIFYESDLSECGLDAAEIACYSGVFTEVFREEQGLYEDKVYCFIHLSVQEFLAALHVHQTFFSSEENLLSPPHSSATWSDSDDEDNYYDEESLCFDIDDPTSDEIFYSSAVDQALQSPNGHLDLFLRFLLGLSLSTNQRLLPGLLTETGSDRTNQQTVKYIKQKLKKKGLSAERRLNLLHCLNELNDHSLVGKIQDSMREGDFSWLHSPAHWSAMSYILLSSDSDLGEFDLRKYQASENALVGLLLVVKASTRATLSGCDLSPRCYSLLASVLSSSALTHLDLSNNDLQDSGVELLCEGLKSAPCRLETLSLSGCLVTERGGASLATALSSAHSPLRELDLSYNHPGASAELLTALQAPHGPLQTLRLDPAGKRWMIPGPRKYSCDFSLDPNTAQEHLLLSEDKLTVTRVESPQPYPYHKDRFTYWSQVLSSTGLRGRCYWEVDYSRSWMRVDVAVSYKRIRRRLLSDESRFGDNNQSWSLRIEGHEYSLFHNKQQVKVEFPWGRAPENSGRVGVFLDSEAGALSFYKVSDGSLFHLHTFITFFNEPVFPGFGLEGDGSVSVVKV